VAEDNVILWPKKMGPPMVCGHCKLPIVKGQQYAMLRLPDGEMAAVHGSCIAKGSAEDKQ
jgi:hypothetical protein